MNNYVFIEHCKDHDLIWTKRHDGRGGVISRRCPECPEPAEVS